jgi:glucuronate isomerase
MKTFIDDNFLLSNESARELYHNYAEEMPIFDFHSHLPSKEIAENVQYHTLTEAWLGGDHYKWRSMRTDGVEERLITGDAPALEKFRAWARVMPHTMGNPLYHWSHLELLRYFYIDDLLEPDSAESIYSRANELLGTEDFSVKRLLERMKVRVVCTSDDPIDSLEHHRTIRQDSETETRVVPTFRPDKAFSAEDPQQFNAYVDALEKVSDTEIRDYSRFIEALDARHQFFHEMGGRSSDHSFTPTVTAHYTEKQVSDIFSTLRSGKKRGPEEAEIFKTAGIIEIGRMNAKRGWTMQLHIGALRNINTVMFERVGADAGFDCMDDQLIARPLSRFLDSLASKEELPKTVIYNLNPRDNMLIAGMIGSFQNADLPGKVQFGSGWWFNDQKDGMEKQLTALASTGLIYRFIGMLTDSRSFLSFPRHEYFRRVLCNLVGGWIENGEVPRDMNLLGEMVRNISYHNAERYFSVE